MRNSSLQPLRPQRTPLLGTTLLSRLERLRWNPRRSLTTPARGERLHGKGGASIEFADYRDYSPGDDLRSVDWNLFQRLNRPYIKQFHHEEEQHIVILLDGSSSMVCGGKFRLAQQLAAAAAVMALMGNERVQISVSGGSQVAATEFPLASGRGHVQRMLSFLEQQSAVGTTPIDIAISEFAQRFRRRGLVLILSDFMTSGDLNRAFNMLYRAGLEIHALQILSEDELTPDLSGDLRLVDCETGATLDLSAAEELAQRYQESLAQQQELLADACRRRMGRFLRVSSQCTVDEVAVGQWCRAGWIQ